jgi:thymidylate synthase (FAD)
LLRYLRRHLHTTPSEMVEVKFHCAMPIFVARQWIRHRTANVNEYSGRYSLMPMLFHTPDPEQLQTQSAKNHQGRSGSTVSGAQYAEAVKRWNGVREAAQAAYEWMTENELARELARIDLPLSTYTQWYWKIDLHNLQHFLKLRVDEHAQWEIQQYGRIMAGMLERMLPLSYEAWIDYDVCGARMSRMELNALYQLIERVDDALVAKPGARLDKEGLKALGLSSREVGELFDKLAERNRPRFALDLRQARSGDHFERLFAEAVPAVDRRRTES